MVGDLRPAFSFFGAAWIVLGRENRHEDRQHAGNVGQTIADALTGVVVKEMVPAATEQLSPEHNDDFLGAASKTVVSRIRDRVVDSAFRVEQFKRNVDAGGEPRQLKFVADHHVLDDVDGEMLGSGDALGVMEGGHGAPVEARHGHEHDSTLRRGLLDEQFERVGRCSHAWTRARSSTAVSVASALPLIHR